MKTWELVCIISSSLVAALFGGPWVAFSPSFKSFHPKLFLGIVTHLSQNLAPAITVLMPLSVLSMIPLLIDSHGSNVLTFDLNLVAFVLSIGSLLVAALFEVPVVNEIAAWTSSSIPDDWQRQRDRWLTIHQIRVVVGLASLLALILAALIFGLHQVIL
jgi:hypothetical protein